MDREVLEAEIISRIRSAREFADDPRTSGRSKMKFRTRAHALSELLGWMRKNL